MDAVVNVIRVQSYAIDDLALRIAEITAVVTGNWSGKMTIGGWDASGMFRYTDTFVRRQDRWQARASQDTRIPQKN